MKNLKYLISAIAIIILFANCQKDDICPASTAVTPLVNIKFYDTDNPEVLKSPSNLTVKAVDVEKNYISNSSSSSLSLPLKTDVTITKYLFSIRGTGADTIPNIDTLIFSYTIEREYVNRACSYIVKYNNLRVSLPDPNNPNNWIRRIMVNQDSINEEDTTHINIYF